MEDIVKRLNKTATNIDQHIWPFRDLIDAVNEIEKLRSENETAKYFLYKWLAGLAGTEEINAATEFLKRKSNDKK